MLNEELICPKCGTEYFTDNNKYYFISAQPEIGDKLDKIKYFFKRFDKLYTLLIKIISPVYITNHLNRFLKKELTNQSKAAINLGSGNSMLSKNLINADIIDYPNVDVVCDISNLPFKSNSIDLVVSIAVLEHVKEPEKVVSEIRRILKPGGKIFIYIPFIQGYHASPYDFQRYTISGIQELFKEFRVDKVFCGSGPASGFLWIFQEWLAILLSFGIKPLYRLLHILIMMITFPVKFLDIFLIYHPFSKNIASGFSIIAEKD
jgi:SAM-dependent methyltransferase